MRRVCGGKGNDDDDGWEMNKVVKVFIAFLCSLYGHPLYVLWFIYIITSIYKHIITFNRA